MSTRAHLLKPALVGVHEHPGIGLPVVHPSTLDKITKLIVTTDDRSPCHSVFYPLKVHYGIALKNRARTRSPMTGTLNPHGIVVQPESSGSSSASSRPECHSLPVGSACRSLCGLSSSLATYSCTMSRTSSRNSRIVSCTIVSISDGRVASDPTDQAFLKLFDDVLGHG